jgi:serine/threonine protein kinase
MAGAHPSNGSELQGHDVYEKVGFREIVSIDYNHTIISELTFNFPPILYVQIRDLNRGSFGMVVLARDKETNELFALKFIERGPQVSFNGANLNHESSKFSAVNYQVIRCPRRFPLPHCFSPFPPNKTEN